MIGDGTRAEWVGDVTGFMTRLAREMEANVAGAAEMQLLETTGERYKARMKSNITESHFPDGTPFAPLMKPRSKNRNQNNIPLWDTGQGLDSFTYRVVPAFNAVIVGHQKFYLAYQAHGIPSRNIVARNPVGLPAGDVDGIGELLSHYANDLLISARLGE